MGATGLKCNFFSNLQRSPWSKKREGACRPPNGRQGGSVALPSGDRWAQPTGAAGGPVAPPPAGDRGKPLYIRSNPPLPSSFEPENSTKNPEKREG